MTLAAKKAALKAIQKKVKTNAPRVEKRLSVAGRQPDRAIVYSAAKYYRTLEKLAKQ